MNSSRVEACLRYLWRVVVSTILAVMALAQAQPRISSLFNPSNNAGIKVDAGDVVNFSGTLEFVGDASVPTSVNVVTTLNIRLNNVFLMPQKANSFVEFAFVDKKGVEFSASIEKMLPIVNGRGSNTTYAQFFVYDEDFRRFDTSIKRGYRAKQAVGFTIPMAAFAVKPNLSFGGGAAPEGYQLGPQTDAANPFVGSKPPRFVRLTLWPTSIVPRNYVMTVVKATTASVKNQVGFTMFDTLSVKKTVTQTDKGKAPTVYGPTDQTITPEELSNTQGFCLGQYLLNMKVGEIRDIKFSSQSYEEVWRYELVKVTKGS